MTKATAKTAILQASPRDNAGKGAARALRREGKVPAILYSKGSKPVSLSMKLNDVTQEYTRGRFRSRLIDIKVEGGETVKALPKALQFHPVTDVIEHVDFMRIDPGMPVRVQVPVHFSGQDKSVGIKRGGVLNVVRHEIEFICKPDAIPTHIEVSVQDMDIGSSVHINDIQLPEGIEATIKRNFTIATVAGRSSSFAEEEVKPAAAVEGAEGAVPAEGAAAPAEGAAAAPAEGAKKDEGKKDGGKK